MKSFWNFTRYASRIIKEHNDLYNFLDFYVEEKVRKHCKVTGNYPTPNYEVLNIHPTDDNKLMVEIDIFDADGYFSIILDDKEITEEKYFGTIP